MKLLDEVLESLKYKNIKAQQADGHISEFMQPDVAKVQEVLEKEREAIRKLNYSAVMPVDTVGQDPSAPTRLIDLHARRGYDNNKKVPPQEQNKYY